MNCVQNAGVFLSSVIRQTVCVDSSLSKVKVKTVDRNRGTPHSQSKSDFVYINIYTYQHQIFAFSPAIYDLALTFETIHLVSYIVYMHVPIMCLGILEERLHGLSSLYKFFC